MKHFSVQVLAKFFPVLIMLAIVGIVVLSVWAEVAVWNECLDEHSWLYCMRTLSK